MNKQLIYSDVLVWISFILMLLTKAFTLFLFAQIHETTKAEIEAVAINYETNPLFLLGTQLQNIGFIITIIILPASAMAYYYYIRRKVKQGKADIDSMIFFVQFVFFSMLINIVNDGAVLIGKLI